MVLGCWFCGEAPRICGEFPSLVCGGGDVETGGGLGGGFATGTLGIREIAHLD